MKDITQQRKNREWQVREDLILKHANKMLLGKGYIGFNLDELANSVEYSKGTLYQHFASKEDIILGVVASHMKKRAELFRRAADFSGRTRQRIFGIGMADNIFNKLYPHAFTLDQLVQSPSVWEKASVRLKEKVRRISDHVCIACQEIIDDAIACGDLPSSKSIDKEIMVGLIGLSKGAHLLHQGQIIHYGGLHLQSLKSLHHNYARYLDGCDWRPLSNDWDYSETQQQLQRTVFSDEISKILSF